MIIQRGLFLASGDLSRPFAEILALMVRESKGRLHLLRLEVVPEDDAGILENLDTMNITEATLFPGIDGFARSLRTSSEIPGRAGGLNRTSRSHPGPEQPDF